MNNSLLSIKIWQESPFHEKQRKTMGLDKKNAQLVKLRRTMKAQKPKKKEKRKKK